jgi:hypothetical protein
LFHSLLLTQSFHFLSLSHNLSIFLSLGFHRCTVSPDFATVLHKRVCIFFISSSSSLILKPCLISKLLVIKKKNQWLCWVEWRLLSIFWLDCWLCFLFCNIPNILVFVIGFLWLTFQYPCFYFLNDVYMILCREGSTLLQIGATDPTP